MSFTKDEIQNIVFQALNLIKIIQSNHIVEIRTDNALYTVIGSRSGFVLTEHFMNKKNVYIQTKEQIIDIVNKLDIQYVKLNRKRPTESVVLYPSVKLTIR